MNAGLESILKGLADGMAENRQMLMEFGNIQAQATAQATAQTAVEAATQTFLAANFHLPPNPAAPLLVAPQAAPPAAPLLAAPQAALPAAPLPAAPLQELLGAINDQGGQDANVRNQKLRLLSQFMFFGAVKHL